MSPSPPPRFRIPVRTAALGLLTGLGTSLILTLSRGMSVDGAMLFSIAMEGVAVAFLTSSAVGLYRIPLASLCVLLGGVPVTVVAFLAGAVDRYTEMPLPLVWAKAVFLVSVVSALLCLVFTWIRPEVGGKR